MPPAEYEARYSAGRDGLTHLTAFRQPNKVSTTATPTIDNFIRTLLLAAKAVRATEQYNPFASAKSRIRM